MYGYDIMSRSETVFEQDTRRVPEQLAASVAEVRDPNMQPLVAEYVDLLNSTDIIPIFSVHISTNFSNVGIFFSEKLTMRYHSGHFSPAEVRNVASRVPGAINELREGHARLLEKYGEDRWNALPATMKMALAALPRDHFVDKADLLVDMLLTRFDQVEHFGINAEFLAADEITPQLRLLIDQVINLNRPSAQRTVTLPGADDKKNNLRHCELHTMCQEAHLNDASSTRLAALIKDATPDYKAITEEEIEFCRRYPFIGTPLIQPLAQIRELYQICQVGGVPFRKVFDALEDNRSVPGIMPPFLHGLLPQCFDPTSYEDGKVNLPLLRDLAKRNLMGHLLEAKATFDQLPNRPSQNLFTVLAKYQNAPIKLCALLVCADQALQLGYWEQFLEMMEIVPGKICDEAVTAFVTASEKGDTVGADLIMDVCKNVLMYEAVRDIQQLFDILLDPTESRDLRSLRGQPLAHSLILYHRKKTKGCGAVKVQSENGNAGNNHSSPARIDEVARTPERLPTEFLDAIQNHSQKDSLLKLARQLERTLHERFLAIATEAPHSLVSLLETAQTAAPRNPYGMALSMLKEEANGDNGIDAAPIAKEFENDFDARLVASVVEQYKRLNPGRIHVVTPPLERSSRLSDYNSELDTRLFKIIEPPHVRSNSLHLPEGERPIVLFSINYCTHNATETAYIETQSLGGKFFRLVGSDTRIIAIAKKIQTAIAAHKATVEWSAAQTNVALKAG